jgi:hypothetical protein
MEPDAVIDQGILPEIQRPRREDAEVHPRGSDAGQVLRPAEKRPRFLDVGRDNEVVGQFVIQKFGSGAET